MIVCSVLIARSVNGSCLVVWAPDLSDMKALLSLRLLTAGIPVGWTFGFLGMTSDDDIE